MGPLVRATRFLQSVLSALLRIGPHRQASSALGRATHDAAGPGPSPRAGPAESRAADAPEPTGPTSPAVLPLHDDVRELRRTLQRLTAHGQELLCLCDRNGTLVWVSPALQRLYQRRPEALVGLPLPSLAVASDRARLARALSAVPMPHPDTPPPMAASLQPRETCRSDAEPLRLTWRLRLDPAGTQWVESTLAAAAGEKPGSIACVLRNIGTERQAAEALRDAARCDPLTGLPNRLGLTERIEAASARATRDQASFAVVLLAIDRIRQVNDTFGHETGDQLLAAVAIRLLGATASGDVLARWSADEFVLLLPRAGAADAARARIATCLAALAQPFAVGPRSLHVGACAGLAYFPLDGLTQSDLLRHAGLALARARLDGNGAVVTFTAAFAQHAQQRLLVENALHDALATEQFRVFYQPIVDATTGRPCGLEALVRWQQGERLVAPDVFIPVAEESGLIVPIGNWVLTTACACMRHLLDDGLLAPDAFMSVNVAARQLRDPDLMRIVDTALAQTGLPATNLQLEITESGIMAEPQRAIDLMQCLRERGIRIAIDDFGTGYSSLAYLTRFPATGLKIDRAFVRDLGPGGRGAAIVRATLALAAELGLTVTAEGIETTEQQTILAASGCSALQGYRFGKPMPEAALRERLGGS